MNRTWIACVAGVLCCWSWAGVDAAPFPGGARPGQAGNTGGKPGPSRDEIKARIDTNKDGQISPQELAAAREKLNQVSVSVQGVNGQCFPALAAMGNPNAQAPLNRTIRPGATVLSITLRSPSRTTTLVSVMPPPAGWSTVRS